MKKKMLTVLGIGAVLTAGLTASVKAAEPGSYTMTDDGGSYTITIIDDKTVKVDATATTGEVASLQSEYTHVDEDTITISNGNGGTMTVDLKADGTFTPVEGPEAYVTVNIATGGSIMTDIEEGKPGDIVTVYVTPSPFYRLNVLKINGILITPNENGICQFTLSEGENIITSEFVINNEEIRQIFAALNEAKEFGIDSLFTVDNLLMFIQWGLAILMGSGWFVTMLRCKKIKNKTLEETATELSDRLSKVNAEEINRFLTEVMGLTIDRQTDDISEMKNILLSVCKCMILAQENTPEARLAIITELTNLKNNDSDLAEQIRAVIRKEQASNTKAIQDRDAAIAALKKENEKLSEGTDPVTTDDDDYGAI